MIKKERAMAEDLKRDESSLSFPDDERGAFGMRLFLLALAVLFAASMVGYAVIRTRLGDAIDIHLPSVLWWSTLTMILSGLVISRALSCAKHGQPEQVGRWLLIALILSLVFLIIQIPGAWAVLQEHAAYSELNIHLYALAFTLIVLHALHVLGGLIPLAMVTVRSLRDPQRYHSYHHGPIRYVAMYWHFLEVVWIVMFGLLLLLG
jgi:heme/copper-type cytochrome/quinol oxidase subunit 3